MKVEKLIEMLKKVDPNLDVVRSDNSGGYEDIFGVDCMSVGVNFPKDGEKKKEVVAID